MRGPTPSPGCPKRCRGSTDTWRTRSPVIARRPRGNFSISSARLRSIRTSSASRCRSSNMFLGHYGLAFAAKRAAPRTSLGALSFAAQFLDELWPILLLLGVEQVRIAPWLITHNSSTIPSRRHVTSATPLDFVYYPFSHSLLMAVVWGAL